MSRFFLIECLHHSKEIRIKMDHLYKSQLQTYAMKQNLDIPVYATEREGPPHAPRFRCKVTFCGQTYKTQEFFPTLKSAEHAAAKVALASLAPQSQEVIIDVAYKNLLQEVAQKENSLLPVYGTVSSGPSHAPTFISTVEFDGKFFKGEEAKTKKLAEMSAAKVAFMSIKNGNSNQTSSSSLPCERQEAVNSNMKSSLQDIHSQPSKVVISDVPSKWIEMHEDELQDVFKAPDSVAKEMNVASPVPENPISYGTLNARATNAMKMNIGASTSPIPQHSTNDCSDTSSCVEDTEKKLIMGTANLSIPSGQHVLVCPWNPEMTLPQDAEMLFRDDRFIAYRLVKS
ncbi:Double-stranded RNA-binding protein 4 [Cardamine amara subsp. amara]|uniref:Double-stranded RNA-binding protein 4 n=1 Tax=Cardamine amara subsp. amara TaxID=228776 RepID=A0ABD0ZTF0_CARAN